MALASFEGRYSKDLFNKSVYTDDSQAPLGYVAKETDDIIVVFSESDKKVRYDIPKSEIAVARSSVIIQNSHSVLSRYKVKRSAPFPEGKSSRSVAGEQEMDVQAPDGLKEAQPEKDRGMEKIKTTSVTPPSPQIVESLNRVITTDSKAIEAKASSTTATKNTGSGSPIRFTSVETFAPKEENKPAAISSQAESSIPLARDSPQSSKMSEYAEIKNDDANTTTVPSHITKNSVSDLGTTDTTTTPIDKKALSAEPLSEQQPLPEVKEQEKIQQVTSEPEHDSEAKAVNKMEPSPFSSLSEDSRPYFSNDRTIKSDEQGQLISPDEVNISVVKSDTPMTAADYSPNSTTPWQGWLDIYSEFTTNTVRSTLNWFDLFWKLWTPTRASAQETETDDNDNR
jgi:hypothetical protein